MYWMSHDCVHWEVQELVLDIFLNHFSSCGFWVKVLKLWLKRKTQWFMYWGDSGMFSFVMMMGFGLEFAIIP